MANLEIAQIQNAALKAAALEVDESGKKDGYIDSSEINLFTEKATALLNEKKCTAQEFATLFATNEVDKTNTTDVFAKVDSLHNAKNTPESLAKEAEEVKRAEKQEKIKEIKAEIAKNDEKLKLYEKRLAQKEIAWNTYSKELPSKLDKAIAISTISGTISAFVGTGMAFLDAGLASMIFGGVGMVGASLAIAGMLCFIAKEGYNSYKTSKQNSPEIQEKIRNEYKEAYMKVSQENEQLKAQLAELQK